MTPLIVIAILNGAYARALTLFAVAGVSDAVDGAAARVLHVSSRWGAYFDPVADKLLLSAVFLALGIAGAAPWWLVLLVFGRDVFILAMVAAGLLFTRVRIFPPSAWGKISTLLQIACVLFLLGHNAGIRVPAEPSVWLAAAGTTWSGIHYGYLGFNALRRQTSQP